MANIFSYNAGVTEPLPFWKWNRVLPAVYDDSLSQYELLCKLLYKVNEIITGSNSMGEQVEQLTQLVQQLIDGQFPSGIVSYVEEIVSAAIAEDVGEINMLIAGMEAQLAAYDEKLESRRSNGIVPTGTIQAIYDCGMTYLNRDIVYKHKEDATNGWDYTNGPERVQDAYGNWGYAINCITFCNLVMAGVPYDQSMYSLGVNDNIFGQAGYCFSAYDGPVTTENYTLYDTTSKLANRLLDLGLAEYITDDCTNVRAGDLVFWLNIDPETGEPDPDQITYHCGFIIGGPYCEYNALDNTHAMFTSMQVINSPYPVQVRGITGYEIANSHIGLVAHIPYGSVPEHPVRLITEVFNTTSGFEISSEEMGYASGTLTMDFDIMPTSMDANIMVAVNGHTTAAGGNPVSSTIVMRNDTLLNKWSHHTVLLNLRSGDTYQEEIERVRITLTDCTIKNVKVFKGIGTIENNTMPILEADSLSLIEDEIEKYAVNSGYTRAYQEMHYTIPVHTTDAIVIGSYTTGLFLYMLDCHVLCSSSDFYIYVSDASGNINGTFHSDTWTWA